MKAVPIIALFAFVVLALSEIQQYYQDRKAKEELKKVVLKESINALRKDINAKN